MAPYMNMYGEYMGKRKILIAISIGIICGILFWVVGTQNKEMDVEKIERGELGIFSNEEIDKLYEEKYCARESTEILENYSLSELNQIEGRTIHGIICREKDILLIDEKDSCILVFDKEGNQVDSIGEVGNGELEFIKPSGIAQHNGYIYVLDAGNNRVQILDVNLTYKESIYFPKELQDKATSLNSIAIDKDGNIYLASTEVRYCNILCYNNETKDFIELGKYFYGIVAEYQGNVYAVNVGMAKKDKKGNTIGWRSGMNCLYMVSLDGLRQMCELPYGLTPTGLLPIEEGIVCASGAYGTIDLYGMDGIYKYSYANSEYTISFACVDMDEHGNIYVGLPLYEKVFVIKKV